MKWHAKPMGQFCKLVNGKAYNAADWSDSGLPIIRIQNLNDSTKPFNYWSRGLSRQVHIKKGDLLIAWSGTPGTSFGAHIWNGPEGVLNQHIFRVDLINGEVTKEWTKFCINLQLARLIDQAHGGVGLKHVTKGAVEAIQIPLPPLAEQKRIAAILDAADALRAKRRESLAQLDTLLRSTFLDMFGDPLVNPKGWERETVGDALRAGLLVAIQDGNHGERHPKVADFLDEGVPFLMANCMHDGDLDLAKAYKLPEEWLNKLRVGFAHGGDALLSHKGTIGEAAIVPAKIDTVILSPQVTYYRTSDSLLAHFLVAMFRTEGFQRLLQKEAKQSTRAYIGITRQQNLPVIIPPIEDQRRFATIVESVEQQRTRLRTHLAELDTLFASLQSRAFNGEL